MTFERNGKSVSSRTPATERVAAESRKFVPMLLTQVELGLEASA